MALVAIALEDGDRALLLGVRFQVPAKSVSVFHKPACHCS